jgi:hypothetical protein
MGSSMSDFPHPTNATNAHIKRKYRMNKNLMIP